MWNQLKHLNIYALCLSVVFGLYAWFTLSGRQVFGDDNTNKTGNAVNTGGHGGGHGYFYHK